MCDAISTAKDRSVGVDMNYEQSPRIKRLQAAFEAEGPNGPKVTTSLLPTEAVQRAAWSFGVYPSRAQILELHMSLGNSDQCMGLLFHEFCLLVTFLQALKRRHVRQSRVVRQLEKRDWDVFLGGACNPTTWRSDRAIPFCEQESISYFNPQVSEWSPELVEIEAEAKDSAQVNLFVLDECVRGTSTMVEMGFLSGAGYNLLPVMPRMTPRRSVGTDEESLSEEEEACLRRAMACLGDLLDRRGYPVFSELSSALRCVKKLVAEPARSVFELTQADGAVPVFDAEFDVGVVGAHLLATFLSHAVYGSDRVSAGQVESILAETVGRAPPLRDGANGYQFSFREVCLLVAAHTDPSWSPAPAPGPRPAGRLPHLLSRLNRCLVRAACRLAGLLSKPPSRPPVRPRRHFDVYLGGSCGNSTWRDEEVIPRLRAAGASFYNPQAAPWHPGLQPVEARARELSRVLLFVITRATVSAASLVEAAHFIGRGAQVVLYVEDLPTDPHTADQLAAEFPLSAAALKDYRRARRYLEDVAARSGVALQPSIGASVDRVLALLPPAAPA